MKKITSLFITFLYITSVMAWEGSAMPRLQVEGRYLKDTHGNTVNLHGFAQTYSPWFNEQGTKWSDYNVSGCLTYNKNKIDEILAAGWKMNFVRMHMDPYWSNKPGKTTTGENDISAFTFDRFKTYLDKVFIPMAEYAVSKGLYVVMRPPGVCPAEIAVGDAYQQYLLTVWGYVSQQPALKNHPNIMFELANEPIRILGPDGDYGSTSQGHFDNLKTYFQAIVDTMRANGCDNILWIPGLGYQSQYGGYAVNPIEGDNIGYAVHLYPGWMGSDGENGDGGFSTGGYVPFQAGWNNQVKPVADFAPIMITEMDWAPSSYNASWGKAVTGEVFQPGFGANFKYITDLSGNVSWLIFTGCELLAKFVDKAPSDGNYTFLTDPEACPWPSYHWYQDYATENVPKPDFRYQSCSDNGDGTYTNPVIHADFPDPDVIRVDDVYYMVSTTMHFFPGCTLLKSYDLVNWEYCSNPLEIIASDDAYNLNGSNHYAGGSWACSLKYHDGKFYILFTVNNDGSYLLTASDPEGEWTLHKLSGGYYDPGLFFDDDNRIYVVHGINNLTITELDQNFDAIDGTAKVVYTYKNREGLEGSHLYKINGYYYLYSTYGGWPAYQVAIRSTDIYGSYEEKTVIYDDNIHQGALIQTQSGEWWTFLFYDKGAYGRLPNLQPITWEDGWPIAGVNGKGVTTYQKPDVGRDHIQTVLPTNDNFRNYSLGEQWQWNHNANSAKWSLLKNPGYLRLYTASVTDSIKSARNTLTQRLFGYHSDTINSYGTIKIITTHMADGDVAGLCVLQDSYGFVGIKNIDGIRKFVSEINGKMTIGETAGDTVYLRAVASYGTSKATFYYSSDNLTYHSLGGELSMVYKLTMFTGNRFAIFNYATKAEGGYVDIDWFTTERIFEEDMFYDNSFSGYSEESLTISDLSVDDSSLVMLLGTNRTLIATATYLDGHTENVAYSLNIENSLPEVADIVNAQIIAKSLGTTYLTLSFEDALGNRKCINLSIKVSLFPLTADLFNPSIYATGTFTEKSQTLVTGQYGFGGWEYGNSVDMSGYKYLVVILGAQQSCGASFRIFDEASYWSTPAAYSVGTQTTLKIALASMVKEGTTTKCDPSHIYKVGFWSYGGGKIVIKDIYLSTPTDVEDATSIEENPYRKVDVYSILGIKVREQVPFVEALEGLHKNNIYLIENKKYIIQ